MKIFGCFLLSSFTFNLYLGTSWKQSAAAVKLPRKFFFLQYNSSTWTSKSAIKSFRKSANLISGWALLKGCLQSTRWVQKYTWWGDGGGNRTLPRLLGSDQHRWPWVKFKWFLSSIYHSWHLHLVSISGGRRERGRWVLISLLLPNWIGWGSYKCASCARTEWQIFHISRNSM